MLSVAYILVTLLWLTPSRSGPLEVLPVRSAKVMVQLHLANICNVIIVIIVTRFVLFED